jgi:hypothetical protein
MIALAVLGIVVGILLAYMEARTKNKFRKKLLDEFESHSGKKAAERHMALIVERKYQWTKSLSVVRKPFNKEINLAIETVALLLAIMALISSIVNFDKNFDGLVQGGAVVIFLGTIVGFIPVDWMLNGRMEKRIEEVMSELKTALERGELESYMAEAKKNWR